MPFKKVRAKQSMQSRTLRIGNVEWRSDQVIRWDIIADLAKDVTAGRLEMLGRYTRVAARRSMKKRVLKTTTASAGQAPYSHESGGQKYLRSSIVYDMDERKMEVTIGPGSLFGEGLYDRVAPTLEDGASIRNIRRDALDRSESGIQMIFDANTGRSIGARVSTHKINRGGNAFRRSLRLSQLRSASEDKYRRENPYEVYRGLKRGAYLKEVKTDASPRFRKYKNAVALFRKPRKGTDKAVQARNAEDLYGPKGTLRIKHHPFMRKAIDGAISDLRNKGKL